MILKKSIIVPIIILLILFTSTFVSLNSIFAMPQEIMGKNDIYVLTSSTDKNPLRSNLNIDLAYALENTSYINAVSPEIFVFTTIHNEPVTLRGVIFSKFLKIENGRLIKGTMPKNDNDVIVGESLFYYMHLHLGENLTVRGAFQASLAVLHIVGVFKTNDSTDDEILIDLSTAQTLAGLKKGTISMIRFKSNDVERAHELMNPNYPKFKVTLNTTGQVYFDNKFNVSVKIENIGAIPGNCIFHLSFQNITIKRNLYVTKNVSFNITLKANYVGNSEIKAYVENDVLNYTYSYKVLVANRPVIFQGKTLTYVDTPTSFSFYSINNSPINDATLRVSSKGYYKVYNFNSSITLKFPKRGLYTICFHKYGYENKTIAVKVFKKANLINPSDIYPEPVKGVIFLKKNEDIKLKFEDSASLYYSIDNGLIRSSNSTISLLGNVGEMHSIDIYAVENWTMENATYIAYICKDYSVNISSYISNESVVYYNGNFTINVWSEIPLKNITFYINRYRHNIYLDQNLEKGILNYTYNITVNVKYKNFEVEIYAKNIMNFSAHKIIKPKVLYSSDIIKPEIIIGNRASRFRDELLRDENSFTIKIWSGQSFTISASDNLEIKNLTVYVFQKYFNASSDNPDVKSLSVTIPTMFRKGTDIYFMPPGIYQGEIIAIDSSGNVNETTFYVDINNTNEKMPPIILGPRILIFGSTTKSFTFRVYDNVGLRYVAFYENDSIIKNVSCYGDNNVTLYLNYSEINDGLYNLTVIAMDVNNNSMELKGKILKNYTDKEPPTILPVPSPIFSGESIIVQAEDNVYMKKLSVYAFGKWFNGTSKVVLPTEYIDRKNDTVEYVPQGTYTLKIDAQDIFDNGISKIVHIEINNSHENIPPVIFLPNATKCNASDILTFKAYDNVKVATMWIEVDNLPVIITNGDNITCRADTLGYGIINAKIFAMDVNGNTASVRYNLLVKDNIPPRILNKTLKIWGGNTTSIFLSDNIGVYKATLEIFGKKFENIGDRIKIPTMFRNGNNISFVPQGTYKGFVRVEDLSGNVNSSEITLIINNTGEKNPPIIVGNTYNVLSRNNTVIFKAYDNVKTEKIWCEENGKMIYGESGSILNLSIDYFSPGLHNVTIYAEDINGNIANISAEIEVVGIAEYEINASLYKSKITENQRGILNIIIKNRANEGNCTVRIYIDRSLYTTINTYLNSYETKSFAIQLPYMSEGSHTIKVNNITMTLKVTKVPIEKLPMDLLLKYDKNLKVTGGKEVIYKGFQISEGNFLLIIYALIAIGMILVALGLYSSLLKGIKNDTIAILRMIGASNKQILGIASKEILIYLTPAILVGIFLGFISVLAIQHFNLMRAFGHTLIVIVNMDMVIDSILVGIGFLVFSTFLIFRNIFHSKIIYLMGSESSEKISTLEEVLK